MNFIINESAQKLRGGYYTPPILADFISKWVFEGSAQNILEPSCGDGNFLESINNQYHNSFNCINFTGIEFDEIEFAKCKKRASSCKNIKSNILHSDFLSWAITNLKSKPEYDAIIGNPPFIRYQYLPEEMQAEAETIFKFLDIKFTKHTNAWVPFVLASLHMLKPGGRFAMVLPAEILHVIHAQAVRSYMSKVCSKILIFDPEDIWFEDTLQGAVIVFAEKKQEQSIKSQGLSIIQTRGMNFTQTDPSKYFNESIYKNGETIKGKWTYALLSDQEFNLYQKILANKKVLNFIDIADVDVGIVTGANKFFLVNDEVVSQYNLDDYSYPMFGKSEHCQGIVYDELQHLANAKKGLPTNFIWFNSEHKHFNELQKKYIASGEKQELQNRYKCRIRNPWYRVPSVYSTELCMLKRSHNIPRIIVNKMNAFTTDTAYRIKLKDSKIKPEQLASLFINSLTALSAELEGRHYGGGVLELVPSEIEKLKIPIVKDVKISIEELNLKVKRGANIVEILASQDLEILTRVGLSKYEITILQNAWLKLKNRRQRTES